MSARISASVYTSHVPAIGVAIDLGQDRRAVLAPAVRRVRAGEGVVQRPHARRDHPRVQRPRHHVQPRHHPDVRHRDGGGLRRRRRRVGATPGARRGRSPRAGVAHRPLGHPTGLRPHDRQPAGGRSRADRPVVADVRSAVGMAVPGDPVPRQRRPLPDPVGPAVPRSRPGDPARRRVVRRRSRRADLGHRWNEPPAARSARRPHQPRVRPGVPRRADRRTDRTRQEAAHRLHPRGRFRGHRTGDVVDRPRRDVRPGRWIAAHASPPLLPRAGEQHRRRQPDPGEPSILEKRR